MSVNQTFTAAVNGDIDAQYQLAHHFTGLGNQPKARYWLERAAQKGHPLAQKQMKHQQLSRSDFND